MNISRSIALCAVLILIAASCASKKKLKWADSAPLPNEPLSMQLPRVEPNLTGLRYSVLLDFENERDLVFLTADQGAATSSVHRHTGYRSLALAGGASTKVKLSSLMSGRPFPGTYTLVGGYFKSDRPTHLTLRCLVDGGVPAPRVVELPAGKWTAGMLDLTDLRAAASGGNAILEITPEPGASIWCDDVLVVDNCEDITPPTEEGLALRRRGLKILGERAGLFSIALDSAEGGKSGWDVEEASEVRALFRSAGDTKTLAIYSDGRSYWDGSYKPLGGGKSDEMTRLQQHEHPAAVKVPEDLGRVIRNSPGDFNNDGYNESRGCYMISSNGSRLQIELSPQAAPVCNPILEISGLPDGKLRVNMEGQLIESVHRLDDGRVLLSIPLTIARDASISMRVE